MSMGIRLLHDGEDQPKWHQRGLYDRSLSINVNLEHSGQTDEVSSLSVMKMANGIVVIPWLASSRLKVDIDHIKKVVKRVPVLPYSFLRKHHCAQRRDFYRILPDEDDP
jgi:hypothetical protein